MRKSECVSPASVVTSAFRIPNSHFAAGVKRLVNAEVGTGKSECLSPACRHFRIPTLLWGSRGAAIRGAGCRPHSIEALSSLIACTI